MKPYQTYSADEQAEVLSALATIKGQKNSISKSAIWTELYTPSDAILDLLREGPADQRQISLALGNPRPRGSSSVHPDRSGLAGGGHHRPVGVPVTEMVGGTHRTGTTERTAPGDVVMSSDQTSGSYFYSRIDAIIDRLKKGPATQLELCQILGINKPTKTFRHLLHDLTLSGRIIRGTDPDDPYPRPRYMYSLPREEK